MAGGNAEADAGAEAGRGRGRWGLSFIIPILAVALILGGLFYPQSANQDAGGAPSPGPAPLVTASVQDQQPADLASPAPTKQVKTEAKAEVTPVTPPVTQTTPPTPLKRPIDNLVNGNLNLSSNLLKNMGSLVPGGDKQQRPWIDPMARLSGSGIRFVQPDLLAGGDPPDCSAADEDELREVIANPECPVITLTGTEYTPTEEYIIDRPITIIGNAATLPRLSGKETKRIMRVRPGGYLELRYVRMTPGQGVLRPRGRVYVTLEEEAEFDMPKTEDYGPNTIAETRGACVLFEYGATGGLFVGVFFIRAQTTAEDARQSITQTLRGSGTRVYGAYIFMAGGVVRFLYCLIFNQDIFTSMNDNINIGGDILVLAGEAEFIGVVWYENLLFGNQCGAGSNIAVLGGMATYTFCYFEQNFPFVYLASVGQNFLNAAGVQIMTATSFTMFGGFVLFAGTGDFTILEGVGIYNGVSITDVYGGLAAYAAGFEFTMTGGYNFHAGTHANAWVAMAYQASAGGFAFVSNGQYVGIGTPVVAYNALITDEGQGAFVNLNSGIVIEIGAPMIDFTAIGSARMAGGYNAINSGFLVMIGAPIIEFAAIDYFAGLGGTTYVGAGAAVLGYSAAIEFLALSNEIKTFWITGTCEPAKEAWAQGPAFFVTAGGGCAHEAAEPIGRALLPGNGTYSPPRGLVAFELERVQVNLQDEEGRAIASRLLPEKVVEAIGRLQALLGAPAKTTRRIPADIYLNNKVEGTCAACGQANLEGPGAEGCVYEPSCAVLKHKMQNPTDNNLSALAYPEQHLIMCDLSMLITSTPAAASLPTPSGLELADALRYALDAQMDDPTDVDKMMSMQVTVYSAEPDDLFSPPVTTPQDPKTRIHPYKAVIVVTERNSSNALIERIKQEDEAQSWSGDAVAANGSILHSMQDYLGTKGWGVRDTMLTIDRTLFVPSYNSEAMKRRTRSSVLDSGTFSVAIIDPEVPGRPLTHLEYGKEYEIHMAHFMPSRTLRVVAISITNSSMQWPLESVTTDRKGDAELTYTFTQTVKPGEILIQATDSKSRAWGSTPALELSPIRDRQRRLYGPIMHF